jgi:phosphatidylinositol alpha-mannosyltransferase
MGRFEENRKGLSVLIEALPAIIEKIPDIRVIVAGPGNPENVFEKMDPHLRNRFTFLGRISEKDKANFMSSVSIYVAPNTGGESFGIILAEALAGGASVLASDIPAFDSLLGHGQYGTLFQSENSEDLAKKAIGLLKDSETRKSIARAGRDYAQNFDWDVVAERIYDVYEMAMVGANGVTLSSDNRAWNKLLGRNQ